MFICIQVEDKGLGLYFIVIELLKEDVQKICETQVIYINTVSEQRLSVANVSPEKYTHSLGIYTYVYCM